MSSACPWVLAAATSDEYNWALGNFTTHNPADCSLLLTLTGTGPYLQSKPLGLYSAGVWVNISASGAGAVRGLGIDSATAVSLRPSASLLASSDKHPLFFLKAAGGGLSLSRVNVSGAAGGQLQEPGVVSVAQGRALFSHCSFEDNSGYAGVLLASGAESVVSAQGCGFVRNQGQRGGVGALQLGASLVLSNCSLQGNSASTQGPAFVVESQASLGLYDCSFDTDGSGTNASSAKAPVYVDGGSVTCDGSTYVEVSDSTGAHVTACHSIGPTHVPTLEPTRAPTTFPTRAPTVLYPTASPTPWGTNMPSKTPGPDITPQVPSGSKSKASGLLWVLVVMALLVLCFVRLYDRWRRSGTRHTLLQWVCLHCRQWGRRLTSSRRGQQQQGALLHTQLLASPRADEEDSDEGGEVDFL